MAAKPGHHPGSLVKIGVDEIGPILGVKLCGEVVERTRSQNTTVIGRRSAETARPLGGVGPDWEAGTFAVGFAPAEYSGHIERLESIAKSRNADVLEVIVRQPRQQVRVDLVVSEIRLVLAEHETAKPPPRPWQGSKYTDNPAVPRQCLALRLTREAGINSSDGQER